MGLVQLDTVPKPYSIIVTLSGAILSARNFKNLLYGLSYGKDCLKSLKLKILPLGKAFMAQLDGGFGFNSPKYIWKHIKM